MRRLLVWWIAFFLLCLCTLLAAADSKLGIYYSGPAGAARQALELAGEFTLVSDPAQADVFVLNGPVADPQDIARRV